MYYVVVVYVLCAFVFIWQCAHVMGGCLYVVGMLWEDQSVCIVCVSPGFILGQDSPTILGERSSH